MKAPIHNKLDHYNQRQQELNQIADSDKYTKGKRIHALTELYFMYQFDVHNQAKIVRRIQNLLS
jgi:hypothetical protein